MIERTSIQRLCGTREPLLGRQFGRTNNQSYWRDPSQPLESVDPRLVDEWGVYSQYGTRTQSLVARDGTGTVRYFLLKDQTPENQKALANCMKKQRRGRPQGSQVTWIL